MNATLQPYDVLSDSGLVRRVVDGDARAADALCRRYAGPLQRFFRKRCEAGAEDLTQETLLALLSGCERLSNREAFRAYAFGTARMKLIVHYRRRRRDARLEDIKEDDPAIEPPPDSSGLRACVEALEPELRDVLCLVYWDGLSAAEVAEALGIAVGTVYSRLHRARSRQRDVWVGAHAVT
jgi:RNA polymerase sigma-70 factor (ECF subfamily)